MRSATDLSCKSFHGGSLRLNMGVLKARIEAFIEGASNITDGISWAENQRFDSRPSKNDTKSKQGNSGGKNTGTTNSRDNGKKFEREVFRYRWQRPNSSIISKQYQ